MRQRIFILASILILFTLCVSKSEDLGYNLTNILNPELLDDTNYRVTEGYPKRIISIAPSNTEILFAIGAGERVVGVTDYCNYPPIVLEKKERGEIQSVGGYSSVNVEKVLALKPDLVLAAYGNGLETIEMLRRLGLNVIAFDPKSIEDVMKDIVLIGIATGNHENATKLVKDMMDKIKAVKEKTKGKPRVKVAHIIWHDPIFVSGRNTFVNEVIEIAGGENAFSFEGWKIISIEDLIASNPDVILVNSGAGMGGEKDILYKWIFSDERLRSIKAVRDGRVYVIDADMISRPSYRLVEAAEIIANLIH